MRNMYLTMIAVLSIISAVAPVGTMAAYGSNDQDSDDDQNRNDPKNQACYNSGFADGKQNHAYNQSMYSQCGVNERAYYEGFLSGCISGQGKDYFSCQQSTNAPNGVGGSSRNN